MIIDKLPCFVLACFLVSPNAAAYNLEQQSTADPQARTKTPVEQTVRLKTDLVQVPGRTIVLFVDTVHTSAYS